MRHLLILGGGTAGTMMANKLAPVLDDKLSIKYNRQRQAAITTELVEIISGAEAL